MTTLNLTVSPDFPPDRIPGWYVFNTWMQKALGLPVHLELYPDYVSQRADIHADRVDAIYANPYDAALLIREKGFAPVARPVGKHDEVVVAARAGGPYQRVEDLKPGARISATDDPDVYLIGRILLEPADLNAENTVRRVCPTYIQVAKNLMQGEAEAGFFLAEAFDSLSKLVRAQLHPLVRSQIDDIHHVFLVGPKLADRAAELQTQLTAQAADPKGQALLEGIGLTGWTPLHREDAEFMIDLMDTLAA